MSPRPIITQFARCLPGKTGNVSGILQCRYAREADNCNKHEKCRDCIIRSKISETFKSRGSFSNFETTMDIQISSHLAGLYSMMVSGRYLSLNGHDYVILTVHDISEERALKSSLKHSNEKFLCFSIM